MTPDQLFSEFEQGFPKRKFTAGLLVAFIDFFTSLETPALGFGSFEAFLATYPRQLQTAAGGRANTLIIAKPDGKTQSLRPFYNEAERFYRAEHKRFDYPSAAPHATQAWNDYPAWLDALVTYSAAELAALKDRVNQFVLATLVSQEFDPASIAVEPPLFKLILEGFDTTSKKGEPTGAAYQGIVFGFLRADNPHLQIEIDKVRTGSKRLQRIGDVDAWEGGRLAISAEVKQFALKVGDVPDLEAFANATGRRGALGIVAALSFEAGAREAVEALPVRALDVNDLLRIVELWDPVKQRTAVSSLIYYAKHVEKNSALSKRLEDFIKEATESWGAPAIEEPVAEAESAAKDAS
ncbi:hypothetical protein [Rhizobium leguminosarum]|jgi:hypothetical protein|uniref:hypothetical protein n=1 Tax=Rhizobium leguminosarum TaxID=384 RepID=UPI0010310AD2|nr:hypothetical protein [Rhizobium leguminosarum]TBG92663.1 hypothetical protein ELG73_37885 [Rhizobium leguminosarum]